jgi:hypothetical protein
MLLGSPGDGNNSSEDLQNKIIFMLMNQEKKSKIFPGFVILLI